MPCVSVACLVLLTRVLIHIDDDFAISISEISPGHRKFVLHRGYFRQARLVVVLSARFEAF